MSEGQDALAAAIRECLEGARAIDDPQAREQYVRQCIDAARQRLQQQQQLAA